MNIQQLLAELVEMSMLDNSTFSSEAKASLWEMIKAYQKLVNGNDPQKQEKMIKLFIGGIISVLCIDDNKYHHSPKLYPRDTYTNAQQKFPDRNISNLDFYVAVGHEALSGLPHSFCGELFKIKSNLINTDGLAPLFPKLAANANKVDQLVKFCLEHEGNLESEDLVNDVDKPYHFSQNFVDEFVKLHKESYSSGCWGGFFNRTNLKYNSLKSQDILEHAKKGTFFGFKNRTCEILEAMNVLDAEGNLLQESVRDNLIH